METHGELHPDSSDQGNIKGNETQQCNAPTDRVSREEHIAFVELFSEMPNLSLIMTLPN